MVSMDEILIVEEGETRHADGVDEVVLGWVDGPGSDEDARQAGIWDRIQSLGVEWVPVITLDDAVALAVAELHSAGKVDAVGAYYDGVRGERVIEGAVIGS